MPKTITEKLLTRPAELVVVSPGDLIWPKVDVGMMDDNNGPARMAEYLLNKVNSVS